MILYLLLAFLGLVNTDFSVLVVNTSNIESLVRNSDKPTIIQYWIPNCQNRAEIIAKLDQFNNNFSDKFQFIYIALTYSDSLLIHSHKEANANFNLYKLDTSEFPNLMDGVKNFNKKIGQKSEMNLQDKLIIALSSNFEILGSSRRSELTPSFINKIKRRTANNK